LVFLFFFFLAFHEEVLVCFDVFIWRLFPPLGSISLILNVLLPALGFCGFQRGGSSWVVERCVISFFFLILSLRGRWSLDRKMCKRKACPSLRGERRDSSSSLSRPWVGCSIHLSISLRHPMV